MVFWVLVVFFTLVEYCQSGCFSKADVNTRRTCSGRLTVTPKRSQKFPVGMVSGLHVFFKSGLRSRARKTKNKRICFQTKHLFLAKILPNFTETWILVWLAAYVFFRCKEHVTHSEQGKAPVRFDPKPSETLRFLFVISFLLTSLFFSYIFTGFMPQ